MINSSIDNHGSRSKPVKRDISGSGEVCRHQKSALCLYLVMFVDELFIFFSSKQTDLYEETFRDLVESVLEGFNGTVFAYGQTGTGKTFTMQGNGCFTRVLS